jgi:hypothetical protein
LAALVVPASALTIPSFSSGVNYLKSRNEDSGALYIISDPDKFADSGGFGHAYTQTEIAAADSGITKIPSAGSIGTEDSWGIVRMYHIQQGKLDPSKTQVTADGVVYLDDSLGDDSTQLVGIFYGGEDASVTWLNANTVEIVTVGTKFELWAVEEAALAASALAAGVDPLDGVTLVDFIAANRTAAATYKGWLDATSKAGGVQLLSGVTTEQIFLGTINSNGVTGNSNTYFDVDAAGPGIWDTAWGSDPGLVSFVNSVPSDMWFNWTITNSLRGWASQSQDNGGVANVIPEPFTMLGLLIGVGSVGGYIRRRRLA